MLNRILKNKILFSSIIGLLITILCTIGFASGVFHSLHETFSNSLYTYNNPSEEIVIIAIDDKSTQPQELGGFGRFSQWSREKYVELLDTLAKENPKVITFDIIFHTHTTSIQSEDILEFVGQTNQIDSNKEKLDLYENFLDSYMYSFTNPIDLSFGKKLKEFDNIILASAVGDDQEMIKPLTEFSSTTTLAFASAFLDRTGVFRYMVPTQYIPSEQKTYDNLAYATAKKYLDAEDLPLTLEDNKMMANFFGKPYSYQMFSFVDVAKGEFPPETFSNKIVLIGVTSAKEMHDEYYTPRSNVSPMPGVEIQANQIQTILEEKFITNQGTFAKIITIAIFAIVLTVILSHLGVILSIVITVTALALYLGFAHFMYRQGTIVNMVYPFIAIILAYLSSWVYKYFIADKGKREIKGAFGRYVSKELVEQISKNPDMASLGGEKRIVTVFFSDLKNSTTLSEQGEISDWVSQLNEYFTAMESTIKHFGGTIDKYEGDAIMGFWNAPVLQEDHIKKAYNAALEMQKMLKILNQKWEKEGRPVLEFRIGINTGEVIVGNIGSKERFNYTVMGDTVNTASRLESGANKTYGTSIIATGAQLDLLQSEFVIREIDTVILPGKTSPVVLYEIMANKTDSNNEIENISKRYTEALQAYRRKDFETAIHILKELLNDSPSKIMLERCERLAKGEQITEIVDDMVYRILNK